MIKKFIKITLNYYIIVNKIYLYNYCDKIIRIIKSVRNSASSACFAESGKYFSRNLFLKFTQFTSSWRVCICCCIPVHQYSASPTSRKVAKFNCCASVHCSTRNIFSHSLSQASASSGVALPLIFDDLCFSTSSIVTDLAGGTMALGCVATGCIASTILWIACAISSAPASFLLLLFAIAWMRHIITDKSNNSYFNFISRQNNTFTYQYDRLTPQRPHEIIEITALIPNVTS